MSANEPLPPELIENLDLPDSTISTDQTTQYYNITSILYYIFQTPQYQRTRHHNITILHPYYITSSRLHNINRLDITILQYYIYIILHLPDSTISTDQTTQYYNITSEAEAQRSFAQSAQIRLPLSCNSKPTARSGSGLLPQDYCERISSKS